MKSIKIIAYTCFALAGLGIILGIGEGELILLVMSISTAIAGILMLALDVIISTLKEIRDALIQQTEIPSDATQSTEVQLQETSVSTKSLADITADIERLKNKN